MKLAEFEVQLMLLGFNELEPIRLNPTVQRWQSDTIQVIRDNRKNQIEVCTQNARIALTREFHTVIDTILDHRINEEGK